MNLYAYVGNDPMNKSDPTGKQSHCANYYQQKGNSGVCTDWAASSAKKAEATPSKPDNFRATNLARQTTKDGRLSRKEANQIRRINTDKNLTVKVDATKLTVVTDIKKLGENGYAGGTVLTDWSTHGNVNLIQDPGGAVNIETEEYNFERHENDFFRNIETDIGAIVAGDGVDFYIQYSGSPNLIDTSGE